MTARGEDGEDLECYNYLAINKIALAPGYDYKKEAAGIYDDHKDYDQWRPRREFPDWVLSCDVEAEGLPIPNKQLVKELLQAHHNAANLLKEFNIDACHEYKVSQASTVLANVVPGDKVCTICDQELSDHNRLRNHIRARHLDETRYRCDNCGKSFGDKNTLSVHMQSHKDKMPFECGICKKQLPSRGKLNEHLKLHSVGRVSCAWCAKDFAEKKSLRDHQKVCKERPAPEDMEEEEAEALPPPTQEKFKCKLCPREYKYNKDLRKHEREKHGISHK